MTFDDEVITDPKCRMEKIRRKMGMVFQSFNLFANLTIVENVMFAPVNLLKKPKEQAYDEGDGAAQARGSRGKSGELPR